MAMTYFTVAQVIMMILIKPFEGGRKQLNKEMFNEIIVIFVSYTVMCFSDFVPDPETRFYIGYVSIGIVCIHLFISLGFMAAESYHLITLKIKKLIIKHRYLTYRKKIGLAVMALKKAKEKFTWNEFEPPKRQPIILIEGKGRKNLESI